MRRWLGAGSVTNLTADVSGIELGVASGVQFVKGAETMATESGKYLVPGSDVPRRLAKGDTIPEGAVPFEERAKESKGTENRAKKDAAAENREAAK